MFDIVFTKDWRRLKVSSSTVDRASSAFARARRPSSEGFVTAVWMLPVLSSHRLNAKDLGLKVCESVVPARLQCIFLLAEFSQPPLSHMVPGQAIKGAGVFNFESKGAGAVLTMWTQVCVHCNKWSSEPLHLQQARKFHHKCADHGCSFPFLRENSSMLTVGRIPC